MTQATKHTPTPIQRRDEQLVRLADQIITMSVQHDELVAALRSIAEAVQYGIKCTDVRAECGEIARAALAKVQG